MRKVLQLTSAIRWGLAFLALQHLCPGQAIKRGPLTMELVSEQKTIVDGRPFWVGWRIVRKEGWHTYWKHPGDVGVPPKIDWDLPDGMRAGEMIYAVPQRVSMGQVKAHGNYGETLFLCRIEPVVPLRPDTVARIAGKASWLTCSSQCLPGFADLSLDLPVSDRVEHDPLWRPRFEAFRKSLPIVAPPDLAFKARAHGDKIDLLLPASVAGPDRYPYFFGHGRLVRSHAPQVLRKGKDGWTLSMRRTPWSLKNEKELSGLVYLKNGWGNNLPSKYLRIRVPLSAP